jgi:arylsulfatase A-like enzyme
MIGSHGYLYKMENCGYQELCNVPFIMRVPGVTWPGSVTHSLVSSVDILPSLLELTSLRGTGTIHGSSFAPLLRKPGRSFHDRIFIHWGPRSIVSFDGEWKFGLHANAEVDELYNLQQDPGEMENLAMENKYTNVVSQKKKETIAWLNETGHPYAALFQRKRKIS